MQGGGGSETLGHVTEGGGGLWISICSHPKSQVPMDKR